MVLKSSVACSGRRNLLAINSPSRGPSGMASPFLFLAPSEAPAPTKRTTRPSLAVAISDVSKVGTVAAIARLLPLKGTARTSVRKADYRPASSDRLTGTSHEHVRLASALSTKRLRVSLLDLCVHRNRLAALPCAPPDQGRISFTITLNRRIARSQPEPACQSPARNSPSTSTLREPSQRLA